jgi:hypothetical protein
MGKPKAKYSKNRNIFHTLAVFGIIFKTRQKRRSYGPILFTGKNTGKMVF